MPKRIQRKRTKGWRMPKNAVYVGRPTKWGNPIDWKIYGTPVNANRDKRNLATVDYERWLGGIWSYPNRDWILAHMHELSGKDLACWCPLDQPCHADVLLRLANATSTRPPGGDDTRRSQIGGG